ncbi:ATP-binding protein [uncultured Pseudacidovorax sp.]|uniref:ATP-binding protein n=1 Tax=uncultured Pseudacidovorax sp. TaxID=679313 RepID=UPI0025DD7D3E|nr:ATP-binding protein [uncultured Pseudacidovorax sp.]
MEHLHEAVERALPQMTEPLGDEERVCEQHGAYTSSGVRYLGRRVVWTACPDCEEARKAEERRAEAQRQAEAAEQRLLAVIGTAGIPARFIGRSFDNFVADTQEKRRALAVARSFAADFGEHARRGTGLVFMGQPGTGKTHLAASIQQALLPGRISLYLTVMQLVRRVRAAWRPDAKQTEEEVLTHLAGVPLLVLDEIGVQYGTDGEATILFEVLDRRYRDLKPTVLITNQDVDGLTQYLGERVFDRLRECCTVVDFRWLSYRAQARKESAS